MAFLLVSVLIGLEVLLRLFDPIGIVYLYDVKRYFKQMLVPNEYYAYIHRPNSHGELNKEAFRFNSIGLRGPDIPKEAAAGKKRLLVLGDSVVLGWGIAEQDRFSNRLQAMFADADDPVEVIAVGAGSWNTRTEYEFLRRVGGDYHPDALLLVIVPNDTDPKRGGNTGVSREELFPPRDEAEFSYLADTVEDFWRFAARHSYVAAYLKYFWHINVADESEKPIDPQSPSWRDARMALDGIIDYCRDQGIEFIVYLDGTKAMVADNPVLQRYDQHLKTRGIEGRPVPDALFSTAGLRISMVDSHLNAKGNRLLAEAMFPVAKAVFVARGEVAKSVPEPVLAPTPRGRTKGVPTLPR
jgi:hypothetical protein